MKRYLSMIGTQRCLDNGVEEEYNGQEEFLDGSRYNVLLPEKVNAR